MEIKFDLNNHWTNKIGDKYIVKRTIERQSGYVAPNMQVTPKTYSWIVADNRETVEEFRSLSIQDLISACEAIEIIGCIQNRIFDYSFDENYGKLLSCYFRSFKEEYEKMFKIYPFDCLNLINFRDNFNLDAAKQQLQGQYEVYDKKLLFLSRIPWTVEEEIICGDAPIIERTIIKLRSRFIYTQIEGSCII